MMQLFTKQEIEQAVTAFDTPLYLYHGQAIREHYRYLVSLLPANMDVFYSMKANPLLGICELFQQERACSEVCSETELHLALKAGFLPQNIIFVGPGKSKKELLLCLQFNIYAVVCESLDELALLNQLAAEQNSKANVLLRINPHFAVENAPLKMGGKPTQFGIDLDFLDKNIEMIKSYPHLRVRGIHIYNGTRILDADAIINNTKNILDLALMLAKKWDLNFDCIDIGGGLGLPYFKGEPLLDIEKLCLGLHKVVSDYLSYQPHTRFILEAGRYLVAKFGYLVTKVLSIKTSHDQDFAITDAGMHCHMAATGIGSFMRRNFSIKTINYQPTGREKNYNISGLLCTPGDVLATQIDLPELSPDDLVIIENSGAYGASASPGRFLSHGYPAEAILDKNHLFLLKRRESSQDILLTQNSLMRNSLSAAICHSSIGSQDLIPEASLG